jgi:lipopolysaccharide transport system permease protein
MDPLDTPKKMSETRSTGGVTPSPCEIIIEPSHGWLNANWREIWEYRDLLMILVRRDFLAKYKQTILGPLWFILQPLLTALVLSIAFHKVAGVSTGGVPSFLFNLCALLPWSYFSQNVTTGAATFTTNAHLFGKVYFPRLIVPFSAVLSNLFALGLQVGVFFLFFAWHAWHGAAISLGWISFMAIPLLLLTGIFSLGLSLLFSASTAKYRDLSHLTPVLLQLWMFASPVFYPLELLLKNEQWSWLAWANPMAPIVEGTRVALLGTGPWSPGLSQMLAITTVVSGLVLVLGIIAFNRAERTVVDSV